MRANSSLCQSDPEITSAGAATPALTVWTRPSDRAPSYGACGQAMEKLTLPHRLPTLAALAPTPSPLLQQRFMEKETSPVPDRARIAPSSQELRHRNSPVKSPGGSTRECEKQQAASLVASGLCVRELRLIVCEFGTSFYCQCRAPDLG